MSDTRLRELERRWKETGSPDDEAAYLLERVRVGDLTQERLELAAYCGHGGAAAAIHADRAEASLPTDPTALALSLDRWGSRCLVRALVAVGRACLTVLDDELVGRELDEVLALAEAWTRGAANSDAIRAQVEALGADWDQGIRSTVRPCAWAAREAASTAVQAEETGTVLPSWRRGIVGRALSAGMTTEALASTMRGSLVDWALAVTSVPG